MSIQEKIVVKGAREHNLKNIDIELPRDKIVAVSGVSGSGKSSLVFDTIFAEGQRRYVESLSAYARQFLGRMDKPDVDYIEGLSPAISIEQKTTSRNPRSTVGTITEIYDYLRLLFARVGQAYCPHDGTPIQEQSVDQILSILFSLPEETRLMIYAPVIRSRKGEHQKVLQDARNSGFLRVRINGEIISLDEEIKLEKNKKHNVDILVDRIVLGAEARQRVAESLEVALQIGQGLVYVGFAEEGRADLFFSEKGSCPKCGFSMPELEPRLFSFNSPYGACPDCDGLGATLEFDEDLIIADQGLSFNDGAFLTYDPSGTWYRTLFSALGAIYGFDLDQPIKDYPGGVLDLLLHGDPSMTNFIVKDESDKWKNGPTRRINWSGIINEMRRRYRETESDQMRTWYEQFMRECTCQTCRGKRLKPEALAVMVGGKNLQTIVSMNIEEALEFFGKLQLSEMHAKIAQQILKEVHERLYFLISVGLNYLTLSHKAGTLSGGEAQRIRLATQLGSSLMGVLYILDEPTIGLHQRDNDRLIGTLKRLRDLGNTVIIVEHDEQVLREADYLVDIGPKAGVHGGYVVAQGTPAEVAKIEQSPTGAYLSGRETIDVPSQRRAGNGQWLSIFGAQENNLKKIDVRFPLGCFNVITGVSGSGKSTLLTDILYPAIHNHINRSHRRVGEYERIEGLENFDYIICIDQNPIGRTPRSNPATYVGLWTGIRDLFASLPESKARGYKAGRFSFNVKGGRCEACEGSGVKKIEMHFLPDVFVMCDVCNGKRFNQETLNIYYKGRTIYDILELTIEEAADFFENIPSINRKLTTLKEVGVGYIKLGQSALTLSGGEAQRVKLSLELSKRHTGKTCYIIDEPTTGLHFSDVKRLLVSLQNLVDLGNTLILIEHNLDVIKSADYLVDLGPEGGHGGGSVLAMGSPELIVKNKKSYTGQYLKPLLD
ncbi:MAG: excinuclease ABC subunit UvrA [Spirochaetia bacterium]